MKIDLYKPIALVYFIGRNGKFLAKAQDDPNDSIVSIQTTKAIGESAGTFSINLVAREIYAEKNISFSNEGGKKYWSWDKVLEPNDLVVIKMYRPGHTIRDKTSNSTHDALRDNMDRFFTVDDNFGLVMLGLIDRVGANFNMGNDGTPSHQIMITGRDLGGKLSITCPIYYFPYYDPTTPQVSDSFLEGYRWLAEGMATNGTPAKLISLAYQLKFLRSANINFGENRIKIANQQARREKGPIEYNASQLMKIRLGGHPTQDIPYPSSLLTYQGSFWNFWEQVANKPWNEMWWDTRFDYEQVVPSEEVQWSNAITQRELDSGENKVPQEKSIKQENTVSDVTIEQRKPTQKDLKESKFCCTLFLRQTPFISAFNSKIFSQLGAEQVPGTENIYDETRTRWFNLPTAYIKSPDIVAYSIGRDDNEVLNWFWTSSTAIVLDVTTQRAVGPKAILFKDSIDTFGLKVFEVATRVGGSPNDPSLKTPPGQDNQLGYLHTLEYLNRLMAGWYYRNSELANGSMTVKGNQDYRVGDRLITTLQRIDYGGYIETVTHNFINFGGAWITNLGVTRLDNVDVTPYESGRISQGNKQILGHGPRLEAEVGSDPTNDPRIKFLQLGGDIIEGQQGN